MTQNDQAAMNEQLTQLRLQGLSVDGDNRYKQDLIDAIIGALLFGAQGSNPPPAGHWLEQFYVIGREEREALARVEAERNEALALAMHYGEQRNEAMSQLAEAVGLLREVNSQRFTTLATVEIIESFIDRHSQTFHDRAQAEQQEATKTCSDERPCVNCFADNGDCLGPKPVEAQGAQAGDEHQGKYWAFRNEDGELCITDRWDVAKHIPFDVITLVERAALATQPAVRGAEHE